MKPELVSFKLCPFVQRSVIVLLEKGVPFDITYINLKEPPEWFQRISPLGKVPLLKVGDTVLFESAVIMEYLDEVNPPSLHPADPLRKAHNRAWIEFASGLLACQYNLTMAAADAAAFDAQCTELCAKLAQLEQQIAGPLFNGREFALVDAAFAPFFLRLDLLEGWHPLGLLRGLPKVSAWSQQLLQRPAVRDSVVPEFAALYREHIRGGGAHGARVFC
ncbi:glutathione S-transferase family protein [Sulfurivermis fontis]|uniref:glutathione S-transferase family protein n=1 Tax=Sulfurivermis fontis TaxID=1972068 RepID=UPI000FD96035|nr:glutathione S-transferase family protein [Sulfurivermis fontis]